jgi:hypothetical protein
VGVESKILTSTFRFEKKIKGQIDGMLNSKKERSVSFCVGEEGDAYLDILLSELPKG